MLGGLQPFQTCFHGVVSSRRWRPFEKVLRGLPEPEVPAQPGDGGVSADAVRDTAQRIEFSSEGTWMRSENGRNLGNDAEELAGGKPSDRAQNPASARRKIQLSKSRAS
jgi:hypothetical protein